MAALGHRTLVSDLYWLSAVQYIGDKEADTRGWDKLLPLIDLVTDLDPRHGYAYQTGGIVLSAAGLPRESDAILKKGIEKGPPYWTFPYYLAFNDWFYRGDFAGAARWAESPRRKPGASPNISHSPSHSPSKSGTPGAGHRRSCQELRSDGAGRREDAGTPRRAAEAARRADAQRLERAVAELERQRGWPVTSLDELVRGARRAGAPARPLRRPLRARSRGTGRSTRPRTPSGSGSGPSSPRPSSSIDPKPSKTERTLQ